MKIFTLFILLLSSLFLHANNVNINKIDTINQYVSKIKNKNYELKTRLIADVNVFADLNNKEGTYSYEGEKIYRLEIVNLEKSYTQDEQLIKIKVPLIGDREDLISHYYYQKNNLVFVRKQYTSFDMPKWHEKHDKRKNTFIETKFYFENDKLLLVESTKKKILNLSKQDIKELLSDSQLYFNYKH